MSEDSSFDFLYNKTLRFLSFRPRSEKEISDYLSKPRFGKFGKKNPNADEKTTQQIINKLKEYKFIDDLEFAKWWIENRKKGIRLIRLELSQKGISKDVLEKALQEFDIEKKEENLLEKLIEKKWKSLAKLPKEKSYERMMRFLLSRGFDYDDVKTYLRKLTK